MPRACRLVQTQDKLHSRTFGTAPSRHDLVVGIISRRLSILENTTSEEQPARGSRQDASLDESEEGEFMGFGPDFDESKRRVLSRRIDSWVSGMAVRLGMQLPAANVSGGSSFVHINRHRNGDDNVRPNAGPQTHTVDVGGITSDHEVQTELRNENDRAVEMQEANDIEELVQEQVRAYRMEAQATAELQKAADEEAETVKKTYLEKQLGGKCRRKEMKKVTRQLQKALRATKIQGVLRILKSDKMSPGLLERAWKVAMVTLHPDRKPGADGHDQDHTKRLIALKSRLSELKD